jgi:hypothetical protein
MSGRLGTRLAAALAVSALTLAGCGVPTSSDVQHVGPGPAAGSGSPSEGEPPPSEDDATTPEEQVDNFLQAAAGSPENAEDRVRRFIRSTDRERWDPEDSIRVVRLLQVPLVTEVGEGSWRVELTVQPVGTLHADGYLDAVSGGPTSYEFGVATEGGGIVGDGRNEPLRLRIAEPPAELLLVDTALTNEDYFYPTPIYFWDNDHEQLVPDLRWLPQAGEPADQHPFIVARWLLAGPAPTLSRLVRGLPAGTQLVGTPAWHDDDNLLVVNFNATAIEGQPVEDLGSQLEWSLLQLRPGAELELRIDDRPQEYRRRAPSWPAAPVRMAVLDGVIRQLADGDGDPRSLPVLSDEVNAGVLAAALTRDGELAALVLEGEAGGHRLSVASATDGSEPAAAPTGLAASEIGQPVWLDSGDNGTGLVVADGDLYRFTAAGDVDEIAVSGLAGRVTAAAVAPDRRRLALIAGDELYVAWLDREGESVTVRDPRALPTTLANLDGVAFSHENRLVVAGERDDRVLLYALTVDGGLEKEIRDLGSASVTSLVAHPYEDSSELDAIMYEADGQAFTFTGAPSRVRVEDLVAAPEDAEALPLSPFFLD